MTKTFKGSKKTESIEIWFLFNLREKEMNQYCTTHGGNGQQTFCRKTFCQDHPLRLSARRFVFHFMRNISKRTGLDILSGRRFVRTVLRVVKGGYGG